MKRCKCENVRFWKYGNGRVSRLASHALITLGVCIFAYFRTAAIAYCGESAAALKVEDLKRLGRELVMPCDTNGWGQLVVRCKVNGADCRLIVDTGCSRTIFDMPFAVRAFGREAVRRYDYKGERFKSNLDSMLNDGSCLEVRVDSMLMDNVEFGTFRATVLECDWFDGDGVLGLDMLGRVQTLVSVGGRELVFNPKDTGGFKSYTSGYSVPGGEGCCSFFDVVNGKPVPFVLDTGAGITKLLGEQGWRLVSEEKTEMQILGVNGIRKVEVAPGMPTTVAACGANIDVKRPNVCFGENERREMNGIGVDVLKDYDLLVVNGFFAARPRDPALRENVAPGFFSLKFDTRAAPDMDEWTRQVLGSMRVVTAAAAVSAIVTSGWPVPRSVNVAYVDKDDGAPAWSDSAGPDIYLNAKWFRENKDGEAAGVFFRELVRVMQAYRATPGATEENCPGWLADGIADFARWYMFEPQSGERGRDCMRDDPVACRYNGSGRATASFLDFLARNHPGTLTRANAALRAHAFDNETFWNEATGKTAAELEKLWRDSRAAPQPPK